MYFFASFLQLSFQQLFRFPFQQRAWFGLSVENIGDIDRDGFDDVAVGAPYMGNGTVFVFRGTNTGLLFENYQVGVVWCTGWGMQ